VLAAHADLSVELLTSGDVVEAFAGADVYVTTHSTSLLEAAALGLPVIYYRVNAQRLHPPFDNDPFMRRRTAASPAELAALLDSMADAATADDPESLLAW